MSKIISLDFEERTRKAVQHFWTGRLSSAVTTQAGGRGSVIGGKNLDGFSELIRDVALFSGLANENIIVTGKSKLTIPGRSFVRLRCGMRWSCIKDILLPHLN